MGTHWREFHWAQPSVVLLPFGAANSAPRPPLARVYKTIGAESLLAPPTPLNGVWRALRAIANANANANANSNAVAASASSSGGALGRRLFAGPLRCEQTLHTSDRREALVDGRCAAFTWGPHSPPSWPTPEANVHYQNRTRSQPASQPAWRPSGELIFRTIENISQPGGRASEYVLALNAALAACRASAAILTHTHSHSRAARRQRQPPNQLVRPQKPPRELAGSEP